MLNRLRSSSLGSLIDLASPRPDADNVNPSPLHAPCSRNETLTLTPFHRGFTTPSPLSGHFTKSRRYVYPSAQAERVLNASKRELTEVIELLQQVRPNDLSQARALLSLMVAILSDTPKCRECMRENAGFLTLVTVLASLGANASPDPTSIFEAPSENDFPLSHHARRQPSIEIGCHSPHLLTDSPIKDPIYQQSTQLELEEERDAVVTLVFKCLALGLSSHRENQLFFSTRVGFKLVLDALRLANMIPQPTRSEQADQSSTQHRRQKIEKLFGALFSFIVADFSCVNIFTTVRMKLHQSVNGDSFDPHLASSKLENVPAPRIINIHDTPDDTATPVPFDLNSGLKYQTMSDVLRRLICDRPDPLRVEVADAVLLLFALHADLFASSPDSPQDCEDNYELYFLSLKAIEILAITTKHSQIALNSIELTAVLLERLSPLSHFPSHSHDRNTRSQENVANVLPSAGLEPWSAKAVTNSSHESHNTFNRVGERQCRETVKAIIKQMLVVGTSLREAKMLFRRAVGRVEAGHSNQEVLNEDFLELILLGMQSSNQPPFIHFGSSKDGCAYALLDSLGTKPFPPVQSTGWTFSTWLQIESFGTDSNALLELLTISDPEEECFVRIAISASCITVQTAPSFHSPSGDLAVPNNGAPRIIQNSAGSLAAVSPVVPDAPTTAEFTQVKFELGRFYHFAVVQQVETKNSGSLVALLIDGKCVDQRSLSWPRTFSPQRLSARIGSSPFPFTASSETVARCMTSVDDRPRWSLGGCWLFNQAMSDDMLFVMFSLGPKIFTCFQDALGSFQTYSSSTLLNLKIDQLRNQASQDPKVKLNHSPTASKSGPSTPSTADLLHKSPLIKAIKEPASIFIPQQSIYFAISAKNGIVIPDGNASRTSSSSTPPSSLSDLPGKDKDGLHYMQKVYTPIGPPSFDFQTLKPAALPAVPTTSAFGPLFANAILNASPPNSKPSDYRATALESLTPGLSPLAMTPTLSKDYFSFDSNAQILELIGDVRLCCPKGLDDAIWRSSGSIFLVRLIQLSSTENQLKMALQIFFEAISHNWRLSEDSEKIQAYETMGLILKSKAHMITLSVHRVLLRFAGVSIDDPADKAFFSSARPSDSSPDILPDQNDRSGDLSSDLLTVSRDRPPHASLGAEYNSKGLRDSVITNPLAFQFLLLDFDLWSSTSAEVQRFHYESLRGMIELSVWGRFSIKRICKMNLLPKMLHALRVRQLTSLMGGGDVLTAFMRLLACVLKVQFNSQVIRHLASYLTASLIPEKASPSGLPIDDSIVNVRKPHKATGRPLLEHHASLPYLRSSLTFQTLNEATMVLKVLHDLLLSSNDQESTNFIARFLKSINGSKWLLMFFHKGAHLSAVSYSLRILTRLIQTQDLRWLQHFKNTLAGFTILRSVLTEFCFQNESILVTTLSLLSQVDIRTVPMFGVPEPATINTTPVMLKEDLQGVIRSIRGIPNELITPEILPIVIGLLKPEYVVRCSQNTMTPVYVMEWLDLRMESQDDGWNEILGDKEMVKLWVNYVTLLNCLPYQDALNPVFEKVREEASCDSPRTSANSSLSSFPLTFPSNRFNQVSQIQAGVSTKFSSDQLHERDCLPESSGDIVSDGLSTKSTSSPRAWSSTTVPLNESMTDSLSEEPESLMAHSFSQSTEANQLKHPEEPAATPTSISLHCYKDASEDVIKTMSKLAERFLVNYVFDHASNPSHSKLTGNEHGTKFIRSLRVCRIEQLLNLVIDRTGDDRAWITPFMNTVIELLVLQTDANTAPLDWLSSTLADGYLSGWLRPDAKSVSQLVAFLTATKSDNSISKVGDLLLVVLTNRHTSSPDVLLEQLSSHRLAHVIAAVPAELVPRLVYILTQYLSGPTNLKTPASDVLKLLFSYHPLILEEFCLNIESPKQSFERSASGSTFSDVTDSPSIADYSMSQVERDLSKVLQMQPDDLKDVLENSSSINLTGKLDWIRFVTESEMKAGRTRSSMQAKSRVMWTEFLNKSVIEARRLENVLKKLEVWSKSVKEIDAARFANHRQDNLDTKHYLEMQLSKRFSELYRPFSVLSKPQDDTAVYWALDSTEGPSRQRKKLRRLALKLDDQVGQRPKIRHHRVRSSGTSRRDSYRVDTTDESKKRQDDLSPISPMNQESFIYLSEVWDDQPGANVDEMALRPNANLDALSVKNLAPNTSPLGQSVSSHNTVDNQSEEFNEDKSRRILKSLEAGDVIHGVWNVEQVIGLDTCPALFLMAKNNIYIINGFFQKSNGELVNSWDAWEERDPHLRTLASLSRQTLKLNNRAAAHQSRRWAYSDIVSISSRKWLFRDICIEFSFADGRSRLLTFSDNKRDDALKRLKSCIRKSVGSEVLSNMNLSLKSQTELWQNGKMSNQAYLLCLNDAAGRTYRDLTQHPVFPWILADYTSPKLDLEKAESFRRLDLPMGAQTEARKRDFIERFRSLEEFGTIGDERMKPAHYMTHYSSAVVVCGFLIRLQPFCDHFIEIQGSFDHADRTFWSIHRAWLSASEQSRSDVRELIPEFFHCPEFLLNLNKLSLGSRQEGGEPIGDVELPPWAHGDPRLFVELHREALESDFVSANIHNWIDLIFGYKQRGQAALDAVNVFQEVSYEGTVSLDAIDDDRERSSVLGAMCNWGLTPSQIFETPHPTRAKSAKHPLEPKSIITATTCPALIQSIVPIREIKQPIGQIYTGATLDKIFVSGPQSLLIPPDATHRLEWGFLDQTLRIFDPSNSLCGTFEGVSSEQISSACFADHRTLVTGSTDSTISLWRFAWLPNGGAHLQQIEVLRGHSAQVSCVVASRTLSLVVSGAEDGLAIIWDLNRALLVQSLFHSGPVSLAAISESTGDIATCTQNTIRLWSINGDLLSTLSISQHTLDPITACCWSRAEVKPLLVTGHRGGKLMFWQRKSVHAENPNEPWKLELLHVAHHESRRGLSEICALVMSDRTLLSGDTFGQLFCWALPGSACVLPDSITSSCLLCGHRFGILESKRRCNSCSAIICSSCQKTLSGWGVKSCTSCLPKLSAFS